MNASFPDTNNADTQNNIVQFISGIFRWIKEEGHNTFNAYFYNVLEKINIFFNSAVKIFYNTIDLICSFLKPFFSFKNIRLDIQSKLILYRVIWGITIFIAILTIISLVRAIACRRNTSDQVLEKLLGSTVISVLLLFLTFRLFNDDLFLRRLVNRWFKKIIFEFGLLPKYSVSMPELHSLACYVILLVPILIASVCAFLRFYDSYFTSIFNIVMFLMCFSVLSRTSPYFAFFNTNSLLTLIAIKIVEVLAIVIIVYLCALCFSFVNPAIYAFFSCSVFVLFLKFFDLSFPEIGKFFATWGKYSFYIQNSLVLVLVVIFAAVYFIKYVQISNISSYGNLKEDCHLKSKKTDGISSGMLF